ncbi:MAG TPA: sulfite exporter TauE/SafE family protein [Bacteroidota bacterium]|nr:sulfite exporter TauE/SafE family protein [Bacteroidota bacterium]
MIEYGLIFLTGALASLHCIGMCGAVVLAYSARGAAAAPGLRFGAGLLRHGTYNGGRVIAYAALGALLSAAGLRLAWVKNAGDYVAIGAGIVMVVAGAAMLGWVSIPARIAIGGGAVTRLHARVLKGATPAHTLALGLLTPLLPCGLLYGMLARAAAAESVGAGALTMAVFALGMTPALGALGGFSSMFSARLRKGAERLAAVSIILMGIVLLLRGLHIPFLGIVEPQGAACCAPPA